MSETKKTYRMPSMESVRAQKAGTAPAPEKPRGLPPRPYRFKLPPAPQKLTAPRSYLAPDGTRSIEEREVVLQNRDIRIIKHLLEFGIATKGIIAALCGASSEDIDRTVDNQRNRLNQLRDAGLIEIEGVGRSGIIKPTLQAHHYYPGSLIDPSYLPSASEGHMLSVSSIAARISRASASDHPFGAVVGWPILSSAQIASAFDITFSGARFSEQDIRATQQRTANLLTQQPGYPGLDHAVSMSCLFTVESSDAIQQLTNKHLTLANLETLPASAFQTVANNKPVRVADFIIPLPKSARGAGIACLVINENISPEAIAAKLRALTTHCVSFSHIVVFIPSTAEGSYLMISKIWDHLIQFNPRANRQWGKDDLLVLDYSPVSLGGSRPVFSSLDKLGPIRSWAKG